MDHDGPDHGKRTAMLKASSFWPPFLIVSATALACLGSLLPVLGAGVLPGIILSGAAALAGLAALLAYLRAVRSNIRRLRRRLDAFVERSLEPLAEALDELSRGNLAAQAEIPAGCCEDGGFGVLEPVARSFEGFATRIEDMAANLKDLTGVPLRRLFYLGADSYREGERCGQAMAEILGDGKGDVAVLMNSRTAINHLMRLKGFRRGLSKAAPGARIVEVVEERESGDLAHDGALAALKRHPSLRGIYVTEGTTPARVARALEEAGVAGRVLLVSHDLSRDTAEAMARGSLQASLSQNPFAQGHDCAIGLYNYLVSGKAPDDERVLTRLEMINRRNLDQHWRDGQGALISAEVRSALIRPLPDQTGRKPRIAFLLPDDSGFWELVAAGAREAAEELARAGVSLDARVPDALRGVAWSVESFRAAIDEMLSSAPDGLCMPVFFPELVPYLNQRIQGGLALATYNSEPLGIRSMVEAMARHARILEGMSDMMSSSASQSSGAVASIRGSLGRVNAGVERQAEQLSLAERYLGEFSSRLDSIVQASGAALEVARQAKHAAEAGEERMRSSRASMSAASAASESAVRGVRALSENYRRIDAIVEAIEDIVEQTSVLAINAAIEASRAGERGKGFAVLAAEIRKLAEKSSGSIREIRELASGVGGSAEAAIAAMEESRGRLLKGDEDTERASASLADILSSSEDNERQAAAISAAGAAMREVAVAFRESMRALDAVNAENEEAARAIIGQAEALAGRVQETERLAAGLGDVAKAQENSVSAFALDEDI